MRKIRPIILITFFAIFLAFGFIFSKTILFPTRFQSTLSPSPEPKINASSNTNTILLVHVDNLEKQKPQLISIWAIFMADTDPTSLTFKLIYPPLTQVKIKPSLPDDFFQVKHAKLSADFLISITPKDFKWNNYLVIDNKAVSGIVNWISGKMPRLHAVLPGSADNNKLITDEEKVVLDNVCLGFSNSDSQRGPQPMWSLLIPENVKTDIFLDDSLVYWQKLTLSIPHPKCEIITFSQ